ncbi:response regulator [Anaerolineales bacterium HSG6]|nr:response regulator [Anaerolineales bacterium HSG6]MDM8529603.1 response regulator [Anaerolineales bacterium HSG25]
MADKKVTNSELSLARKSTILIVDDNEYGRDILRRLLIAKGYQLAFAANGVEALNKAAQLVPDLVLLDVMMPGMDGFEVCRRLRKDAVLADIPIIMLTAMDEPNARVQGLEVGADDFITKPFDRDELRARVQTIIRLNRFRRLMMERTKFEWVVENADDGYVIIDEENHILYTNPRARLYLNLGLPQTDKTEDAQSFLELIDKDYYRKPTEAWTSWPYQSAGEATRYLMRPESTASPAFWLQVDILNLTEARDNLIIRLRDVTSQMNLEKDMRGFHEAVRHKLRTPILGMLNNLELLGKHADKMSHGEVMQFARMALKSTKRLHSQVQDVLKYLHAPNLPNDGQGFPVNKLVETLAIISNDLEIHNIKLTEKSPLGAFKFNLSRQTLELILVEILSNAKKFHPQQQPNVEVILTLIENEQVSIQIYDDGIHLSPEQLANAWSPYYQGEKYFTGEIEGMGLGLSLVALLIREVNGAYHITNRTDKDGVVVEIILSIEPMGNRS